MFFQLLKGHSYETGMEGGTENKEKEVKENLYISNLSRFFILLGHFTEARRGRGHVYLFIIEHQ